MALLDKKFSGKIVALCMAVTLLATACSRGSLEEKIGDIDSGTGVQALCSDDQQNTTDTLQVGNLIQVEDGAGYHFMVSNVDDHYSCEGLSWVQADGYVVESTHASASGSLLALFIDGQPVNEDHTVFKLVEDGVTQTDADTLQVEYLLPGNSAAEVHQETFTYHNDGGQLQVSPEMNAVGWNLDLSSYVPAGDVVDASGDDMDFVEVALNGEQRMRCSITDSVCEVTGGQYWQMSGLGCESGNCNAYDYAKDQGMGSNMGQGWDQPAVELEAGKTYIVQAAPTNTLVASWDGQVLSLGEYSFDASGAI
ncbi:MAG: hypothetical protein Q3976_03205 [Corynebacterium sp.]|nr:hypothetical protein [Corynebacterium sp.]